MHMDWILSPLTLYAILALGLLSCVGLWLITSICMHTERRRMAGAHAALRESVNVLSTAVEQMRIRARATDERVLPPASFNLTKRANALRMHRHGESLAEIATALQSPQNEIELLLRIDGYLTGCRQRRDHLKTCDVVNSLDSQGFTQA